MPYVPRHADLGDNYPFDPDDPREAVYLDDLREVLDAMPLDPDRLGDGGGSDWTLGILFALAGVGDADASAYIAPRLAYVAGDMLADLGYPGPAFEG